MKKRKGDVWVAVCMDRNQLPQRAIDKYRWGGLANSRAVPLPLGERVVFANQYEVKAVEKKMQLHSLTTVKSLGFIPSLDTKVAPLSVSFLSDPVGDAMNVLDRRCRAFSARIEDC